MARDRKGPAVFGPKPREQAEPVSLAREDMLSWVAHENQDAALDRAHRDGARDAPAFAPAIR